MEITIEGDDKNLLRQVENLARKLGLKIQKKTAIAKDKKNGVEMSRLMTEMAKSGGIKSISDPESWQREIRKDRPLPGRE